MGIRTGIAGASGYTGAELLRLIEAHPEFEVAWVGASSSAGDDVGRHAPGLFALGNLVLSDVAAGIPGDLDLLFVALPSGEAAAILDELNVQPKWIVDLGADFRHKDPETYKTWYGVDHPTPDELDSWVYGLTEWNREAICAATRVANPGCYPTAALLGLLPLAKEGLIGNGPIFVDGKSGVSGAGRSGARQHAFSEVHGDVSAYAIEGHRHLPEMEDQLALLGGEGARPAAGKITFVPHLVPMARGLMDTMMLTLAPGVTQTDLDHAFRSAYSTSEFVHYVASPPNSKALTGSNSALVASRAEERTGSAVVICAIDNLVKGAAGQAIQNANLMVGLEERTGLPTMGLWP